MHVADSQPYQDLKKYMSGTRFVHDVEQLSPVGQTSSLEAFHALVLWFAPKYVHYGYHGMRSR